MICQCENNQCILILGHHIVTPIHFYQNYWKFISLDYCNVLKFLHVCSPRLYNYFLFWSNIIYSCDGKTEFSASLQYSVAWSFRNHSNMLIFCSGNISYYIITFVNINCLIFFVETVVCSILSLMNRTFKRTVFIWNYKLFISIINGYFHSVWLYCIFAE